MECRVLQDPITKAGLHASAARLFEARHLAARPAILRVTRAGPRSFREGKAMGTVATALGSDDAERAAVQESRIPSASPGCARVRIRTLYGLASASRRMNVREQGNLQTRTKQEHNGRASVISSQKFLFNRKLYSRNVTG